MKQLKWVVKIIIAIILFQTLFFKFSGAPESVYIFSKLRVEPWGRWATGVLELLSVVFILMPATAFFAEILIFFIMSGALMSHVFILGFSLQNDGGLLFSLAVIVFVLNLFLMILETRQKMNFKNLINKRVESHE